MMALFPLHSALLFLFVIVFVHVNGIEQAIGPTSSNKEQEPAYKYHEKYIDMPLDHFTFRTNATFKLRYLINDTYWRKDEVPPGPILFYTGNEGDITMFAQNTGFVWELAPQLNGLIVFAEHRFYGSTMPFGNASYEDPAHLGYLSSSQALADFVYLIGHLRKSLSAENNAVIAFGGSYGGMLASWIRIKYPSVVQGAIASSAPILMFPGLNPCEVYNRVLTSAFNSTSTLCATSIRKSWDALDNKAKTAEGLAWVSKEWNLCKPMKSASDMNALKYWFADVLSNVAMTNYPYASSFLNPVPAYPVFAMCRYLNIEPPNDEKLLQAIFSAFNVYTNYTGQLKCLDTGSSATQKLGDKGWSFQACTEMVMPICADGLNDFFQPYKWDLQSFSDECYKMWKVRPDPDNAIFNYGGNKLSAASNIVFSNGLLDPWSSLGVLQNVSSQITRVIIPEGAHHLDLRASNPADPESVVFCRSLERRQIKNWILQHYKQLKKKGQPVPQAEIYVLLQNNFTLIVPLPFLATIFIFIKSLS